MFSPNKISSFFSGKDKNPSALKSYVVYIFICASCNSMYVGCTHRYCNVRIQEYLHKKSQPSNIFKYLAQNRSCKEACDHSYFEVIDSALSFFRLKIKEAMHIGWIKPTLNGQKKHVIVSISV